MSIVLLLCVCLMAGAKEWFYYSINAPEGNSNNLTCSYVEQRGHVWIGTTDGLFRVGYNRVRQYHADGNPGSLPGNKIITIVGSTSGKMFVVTDKGTAYYNPATDGFNPVYTEGSTTPTRVYCYLLAQNGKVYIGGDNVLYELNRDNDLLIEKIRLGFARNFQIQDILEMSDGRIFLYNDEQGICEFFPSTNRLSDLNRKLGDNHAHYFDSRGTFWRSRYNRGIECYDSNFNLIKTYTESNSGLTSNLVTCFLERDGQMFIGTDGGGINILDPENGNFTALTRDYTKYNSFPSASVVEMNLDAEGAIWATIPDGSMVYLKEAYLRSLSVGAIFNQSGRSSDNVLCMAPSRQNSDIIWVGTQSSGLYKADFSQSGNIKLEHQDATAGKYIESIVTLHDGRVLMAYHSEGLFIFDPHSGRVSPLSFAGSGAFTERMSHSPIAVTLAEDSDGHVLILADVVMVWNPETGNVLIRPLPAHPNHTSIRPVSNGAGRYFYCERYIYTWDNLTHRPAVFCDMGEDVFVNSVTLDQGGIMWIAANDGIYCLAPGEKVAKKRNAPIINSAESILSDSFGRLWVGTSTGINLYLPQVENVLQFSESDGAGWNKYNGSAWAVNADRIIFGGTNGLLIVDPRINLQTKDVPEMTLEDVYLDEVRVSDLSKMVVVPQRCRKFQINFFVRENNMLRSKQFRFDVAHRGEVRQYYKDKPSIVFNTLPPGKFAVSLSCTLPDGSWTEPQEMMQFRVRPVWFRSLAFWALIILIVLILARIFSGELRKQDKIRMELAKAQESADAQKENLKFLLNVSHELKTPLTLIANPLARLLKYKSPSDPDYFILKNIQRQTKRMSYLILTVLDAHKIQEGSAKLNAAPVALNDWVESIFETFDDEADSHEMHIVRSYDTAVGEVPIDAPKLENVLTNMMVNAFKHSQDRTTIKVGTILNEETGMVRVYVSDQGEGLGGVDMTKLFGRYYQGYAQKTGSGLGLAYANSIVELHNGTMGAKDNPDGGAIFYFDIPVEA